VFYALSEKQLKQIVEIQLERLRVRLAARHIHLELTDEARASLVHSGYNDNYGACPLKRAIQKRIETPMGKLLLGGQIVDGQTVLVDVDSSGDLRFLPQAAQSRRA